MTVSNRGRVVLLLLTLSAIPALTSHASGREYIWIPPGGEGWVEVVVRGSEDLAGQAALTAEAPDFISWSFSPGVVSLSPGSSASSNLTLSAAPNAPVGEYEVLVLACSGEVCSQTTVPVAVGELNVSVTGVGPRPTAGEPAALRVSVEPIGPPPEYVGLTLSSTCADLSPRYASGAPPLVVNVSATSDEAGECAVEAVASAGGVTWSSRITIGFLSPLTLERVDVSVPASLELGEELRVTGTISPAPPGPADLEVTLTSPAGDVSVTTHGGSVDREGRFEFIERLESPGRWEIDISLISPETGERIHIGTYEVRVGTPLPDLRVTVGAEPTGRPEVGEPTQISLRVLDSSGSLSGVVRVNLYDETAGVLIFSDDLVVKGGSSDEITIEYSPTEPGLHAISAVVDPGNEIAESNEDNNGALLEVTVPPPPPSSPGPPGSEPPAATGTERGGFDLAYLAALGLLAAGAAALVARRRFGTGPQLETSGADPCEGLRRELLGVERRLGEASSAVPAEFRGVEGTDAVEERLRADLEDEMGRVSGEIQRLRSSLEGLEAERDSLDRRITDARERIEVLNRRLRRLESLRRSREEARQRVKEARQRLDEALREARGRARRKSERLREGARYRGLERRVRREEERLMRAVERLEERPESRSRRRAVERAEARLAEARGRLGEYERKIEEKVAEMERRLLEGSLVRGRRREVARREARLKRAEERLSSYERRHSGEIDERDRLKSELESSQAEMIELDRGLAEERSRLAELEERLRELAARGERVGDVLEAHRRLARLRSEREGVRRRLSECEERMRRRLAEEADRRRRCEEELEATLNKISELRSNLEERRREIEGRLAGLLSEADSLDSKLEEAVAEWRNAFSSFLSELREVSDVLKLAGADVDPTQFSGIWDWGDGLLGALGTSAGYALEDLVSTPLPTDLVKAVGGIYSIMSSLLNPMTAGGSGLLLEAGGPEEWAEIQRAFSGFRRELEKSGEDPARIGSAAESVRAARPELKRIEKCLADLSLPRQPALSGDCESDLAAAREALGGLEAGEKRLEGCESLLKEGREKVEGAGRLVRGVKSRASSLRQTARGLQLYRQAVARRFRLGG